LLDHSERGQHLFCTVVIPTIGRATLSRAVNSVIAQDFTDGDVEAIVVNDSGQPLELADWQHSGRVSVITTNRIERGAARNAGASLARGRYLWFLDDDDWLLPGALEQFWRLARVANEAAWLYGNLQVVDEAGKVLAELNPGLDGNCFAQIMGGVYVPIQASLIRSDMFFAVGGYDPSICGTEDLDLCRRIALQGDFAHISASVACLFRGPTWKTSTNYLLAPDDNRRSRDAILGEPGVLRRLLTSARSSYWYGRICHVILSTTRLNLQRRRIFTALSRSVFGLAWFGFAGWRLFSPDFWLGLTAHHTPDMLNFMESLEREAKLKPRQSLGATP
jgi:glycosyltransferase involved in cell wall biosynthesis